MSFANSHLYNNEYLLNFYATKMESLTPKHQCAYSTLFVFIKISKYFLLKSNLLFHEYLFKRNNTTLTTLINKLIKHLDL